MKITKARNIDEGYSGFVCLLTNQEAIVLKKLMKELDSGVSFTTAKNWTSPMYAAMDNAGVPTATGIAFTAGHGKLATGWTTHVNAAAAAMEEEDESEEI